MIKMRLDEEVNFNQNNGIWITRQGIIDHNFEYLFYKIVPKIYFHPNSYIGIPTATSWQSHHKGTALIEHGNNSLRLPPVYNKEKTYEILSEATFVLENFHYKYDNFFYKIPNDIYIMYHHTTLKPDLCKYFYLKQLIIHDLVDLIFYYVAEAIRLDINHYPIVYPITKLPDNYIINRLSCLNY